MKINIDENNGNQRLDRFLRKFCKDYPEIKLNEIFGRIRKGIVKVNGKKSKEEKKVIPGDIIEIDENFLDPEKKLISDKNTKKEAISLEKIANLIIYEDDNRLVFNKPSDIVMHEGKDLNNGLSIDDYLQVYCEKTGIENTETFRPNFCYRLDKDTSGVLVAAKNYQALQYLNEQIRDRKVDKHYMSVVVGTFPSKVVCNESLEKVFDPKFGRGKVIVSKSSKAQEARTEGTLEKAKNNIKLGPISLVKVKILTGRMHQIRVHLANKGFPILGDIVYGNPGANRIMYKEYKIPRQLLHAFQYSFFDKFSNKTISFQAPIPPDFEKIL